MRLMGLVNFTAQPAAKSLVSTLAVFLVYVTLICLTNIVPLFHFSHSLPLTFFVPLYKLETTTWRSIRSDAPRSLKALANIPSFPPRVKRREM